MPLSLDLDALDFSKGNGLISVVVQNDATHAILMFAFADREALERTLETGQMHFRSRTRGLWKKGETSGHTLDVVSLTADCDRDAILARVIPHGPTCHTGTTSCFGEPAIDAILELESTITARATDASVDPSTSYTARLLRDRNLRLKKIGEEAAELLIAIADQDRARVAEEAADLLYHTIVALRGADVSMDEVRAVLASRVKR